MKVFRTEARRQKIYSEAEARASVMCPGCGGAKDSGTGLVCWSCFKSGNDPLKYCDDGFEHWQRRRGNRGCATSAQHTPGPWTWRDGNVRTWNIVAETDIQCVPIAEIPRPDNDDCGVAQADANARLIAAAPELLAASRAVFEAWESGDLALAVRRLAAAAAKAEGKP